MAKDPAGERVVEALQVIGVHMRQEVEAGLGGRNGDFGDERSGEKPDVFGPGGREAVDPDQGELEQVAASLSATADVAALTHDRCQP